MKVGEFNLGIRDGDKVEMYFDDKQLAFIFQGYLPNNHVWIKAQRLYAAINQIQNAPTMAADMQRKYGFEIHIHAYFINKILPDFLKHQLPQEYKRKDEYQETLKTIAGRMEQAKNAAMDTQGAPNIGKVYAADYQKIKTDYETLLREWQELEKQYQREMQELQRLATNANAAIFTISISSDMKVVPDGSAVPLALNDCLQELNMRHNTLMNDAMMQGINFVLIKQPYFFFLSELAGMFNPLMLANQARGDISIFELYKEMFPAINAKSMLQANLENMRHLTSSAPAEMLHRILQQMKIAVPVVMPQPTVTQGVAQGEQDVFKREDYLTEGVLVGTDRIGGEVRIPFRTLDKHILIEGVTQSGKSQFAKLMATEAIKYAGMKVIVLDITWGWTRLAKLHDGIIFDKRLDVAEALKHDFSLCIIEEDNLESAEQDFLKPFYDYIIKERLKIEQEGKDILLIIDETHKFSKKSKSRELVNLATQISKYGVVLMFITQRSEQLNIHARSQTTLQFISLTQDDYYRAKADIHSKEWTRAMQNIKKYNLFVHGAEIQFAFEVKPLHYDKYVKLSKEEYEHYRYKGFDASKVDVKAEPMPQKEPIIEKPTPETKVEPTKPIEPKKEGWDLNNFQRIALKALFDNPDGFESYNQWFISIGRDGFGGEETKVRNILRDKGFIEIVPDPEGNKKKIGGVKITEKGKAVFL